MAVGEPIRLGSANQYELEHHPISDRLIIRDTENSTVAYVRQERGGQIGGDGTLIEALKEGKPMADDGKTYQRLQTAERHSDSWMFVPPGTFNEVLTIDTDGLTVRGSGFNTLIDGGTASMAIRVNAEDVTVEHLRTETTNGAGGHPGMQIFGDRATARGIYCRESDTGGILCEDDTVADATIVGCIVNGLQSGSNITVGRRGLIAGCTSIDAGSMGYNLLGANCMVVNSVSRNAAQDGVHMMGTFDTDNCLVGGNRIIGSGQDGIHVNSGANNIVFNNRVSDSGTNDINDQGTNTLFDANVTGVSN